MRRVESSLRIHGKDVGSKRDKKKTTFLYAYTFTPRTDALLVGPGLTSIYLSENGIAVERLRFHFNSRGY